MGTISSAQTTVDAYHRLISSIIPKDASHSTGCLTQATAEAFVNVDNHSAATPRFEGILRANLGARRVGTGTANHHDKAALHAAN
jgi:hypothetical protein